VTIAVVPCAGGPRERGVAVGRALADHDSAPQAVCVHPDPADGDEAVGVLFSMVCHLEERRMWVADGTPCSAPFEEIDLGEALR
jgi:hypothetical protein